MSKKKKETKLKGVYLTKEFIKWANNDLPYLKKTIKKMLDEQHGDHKDSK